MKILALDAADGASSIAWSDGRQLDCRRNEAMRDSLSWLMQQLAELRAQHFPDWRALDGIACCIGPGGFTGVRVAVGYAQGLGLATGLPVLGVSSLDALAEAGQGGEDFWVALDARMGELYAAHYRRDAAGVAQRQGDELLITPQDLAPRLAPGCATLGPGFVAHPPLFPNARPLRLDAAAVARRARRTPLAQWPAAAALAPTYLRNKVAQTLAERRSSV